MPTKIEPLQLSNAEREVLCGWARCRQTGQALAIRSRIVLACADGGSHSEIARNLGVTRETVRKWRNRFERDRLEGLRDEPRPGAPRKITDEQVEHVITKTLESPPPHDDMQWSTRSMAAAAGMSQSAISRIWRAFGLKPDLVETWKLTTDAQFVDKVHDVVGLYLNPPQNALVLCVQEDSQIQALDGPASAPPIMPTTPQPATHHSATHHYVRHGIANLFAAFNVASGPVNAEHHGHHQHEEFLRFLASIDTTVAPGFDLYLICDSDNTHKTAVVKKWLLCHPRFQVHLTPTSASWMNLVDAWFGIIEQRAIRLSTFGSVRDLTGKIHDYISGWNPQTQPFIWTKTADHMFARARRPGTSNAAH